MSVSLKQQAYEFIRERLIRGELNPGAHLSEVAWAKEIGISRTPVREALTQLQSEGLLARSSGTGVMVKSTSRKELAELYDIRRVLEELAAGRAARFATAEQLQAMDRECAKMEEATHQMVAQNAVPINESKTWPLFVLADVQFHILIMRSGRNERMLRIVDECHILTAVCGHHRGHPSIDPIQSNLLVCREHRAILDAIVARDPSGARRAINWHLRSGKAKALANYDWSARRPDPSADWSDSVRHDIRQMEHKAAEPPTASAPSSETKNANGRAG